jgi:hypothetical protein
MKSQKNTSASPDLSIHTCSYYCDRPICLKDQRDALRDKFITQLENDDPISSKIDVAINLYLIHELMLDVAVDMDYYGGFNEHLGDRAKELSGAACILKSWAQEIENRYSEESICDIRTQPSRGKKKSIKGR